MSKKFELATVRAKLADLGLLGFARGALELEGDHIRLALTRRDSKGLSQDVVSDISAILYIGISGLVSLVKYRAVEEEKEELVFMSESVC